MKETEMKASPEVNLTNAHSELSNAIERLAELVTVLQGRLGSILRDADPEEAVAAYALRSDWSETHVKARQLINEVNYITARIESTTARIDL